MSGEVFSSIDLQVYISNAWVSLWTDVLHNPRPKGNRGIMGNDPEARVGDPGRLTFSLDNSASNSAGLIGRYSPGHANVLSGWTVGLPVQLIFTYKGFTRYKWYGRIEPDGIKVIPGTIGTRRVDVSCHDFMGQAAFHKVNLLAANTNQTVAQATATLLANMPIQPLTTDLTDGTFPMTYVFDNFNVDTTAISEFNKFALSARGYEFITENGVSAEVLRFTDDNFQEQIPNITTLNFLLLETGDKLLLETGSKLILDETEGLAFVDADYNEGETEISYGKDIINYVTVIAYPRRIDAAATTVLYTLQNAVSIAAGVTITLRGQYLDPTGGNTKVNGKEMVTPVSGTDYKANASADGTGADMTSSVSMTTTFGAAEVEFSITNTHGSTTLYIGGATAGAFLRVRGKGIYLFEPTRTVGSDATSIATHGVRPLNVDTRYSDPSTSKNSIANGLVTRWKNPGYAVDKLGLLANRSEKNMYAFLFFEPRWFANITESMTALSAIAYVLMGYDFEIINGTTVKWYPIFQKN